MWCRVGLSGPHTPDGSIPFWSNFFLWALAHVWELLLVDVMHCYVIQWIVDDPWGHKITQDWTLGTTHSQWEYSSLVKISWWASEQVKELLLANVDISIQFNQLLIIPEAKIDPGSDPRDHTLSTRVSQSDENLLKGLATWCECFYKNMCIPDVGWTTDYTIQQSEPHINGPQFEFMRANSHIYIYDM